MNLGTSNFDGAYSGFHRLRVAAFKSGTMVALGTMLTVPGVVAWTVSSGRVGWDVSVDGINEARRAAVSGKRELRAGSSAEGLLEEPLSTCLN